MSFQTIFAQSVSDSELISRIKVNATHYQQLDHGPNLKDQADALGRDIVADRTVTGISAPCTGCKAPDATDDPEIEQMATKSDLIVIAKDVRNISAFTENHAFIFTDSEMAVQEIWKKAPGDHDVLVGDEITITRPGGELIYGGHRVRAFLSDRPPLHAGHLYIMYLKYLPDSRSYTPISTGGFDISSPAVEAIRTSAAAPAQRLMSDRSAFLQKLRQSTNRGIGASR